MQLLCRLHRRRLLRVRIKSLRGDVLDHLRPDPRLLGWARNVQRSRRVHMLRPMGGRGVRDVCGRLLRARVPDAV